MNLLSNRVFYSNQPSHAIPLRLAQVRDAIFFVQPMLGPRASLRTASANLNGTELVCALVSHAFRAAKSAPTGGRRWDEPEYCVDLKSANLVTYSPVPGLYVYYDYSKALPFHDKLIPNKFTITQAGHTIIEAQTDSIADPSNDLSLFQPSGLNAIGVGPNMTGPLRFNMMLPSPAAAANGTSDMVVVHGMQSSDGHLTDVELIASTNASLNNAALEYANRWSWGARSEDFQPGATSQSQEVFLTLQYAAFAR